MSNNHNNSEEAQSEIRCLSSQGTLSSPHVRTRSVAHSLSQPKATGDSFPGVQRPGLYSDHSPISIAKVKKSGANPHSPYMYRSNFPFFSFTFFTKHAVILLVTDFDSKCLPTLSTLPKILWPKHFAVCMAVGLPRTDNQNQQCSLKFRAQGAIKCDASCNY